MKRFKTKQQLIDDLEGKVYDLEKQVMEADYNTEIARESEQELTHTIPAVIDFLQLVSDGRSPADAAGMVTRQYDIDRRLEDAMFRFTHPAPPPAPTKRRKK